MDKKQKEFWRDTVRWTLIYVDITAVLIAIYIIRSDKPVSLFATVGILISMFCLWPIVALLQIRSANRSKRSESTGPP